jgi:ligand-binding sensor domain-containing protein
MHMRRDRIGYMAAIGLMILSLACGGGARGSDATPAPATLASTPAPVATSLVAPTPEPAEPEISVELGQPERNEDGGFAFRVIPGYEIASFGGMANMLAPGADPDVGPVVSLMGWTNESEKTNADLYAELKEGTPMMIGEAEPIVVQGIPGLAAVITGDNNGKAMQGRAAMVMVTPTRQFTLLVGAPAAEWGAVAPYFDAVLASLEFFEPIVSAPASDLLPGSYAYVNSNVVRDVLVHEDIIYAATLGGVVTRNLDGAYANHYTPIQGMGHVSSHSLVACEIFGEERIVVGTLRGLTLFDPANMQWDNTPLTPADSYVATNRIDRLYCDREQRWLLIGYSGLGIMDIDAGDFVRFTDKQGLSWNGISDIAVNGSDIWVASGYNGISRIRGAEVTVYNLATGMPDERANALAFTPDGTLWVGGSKGLMKFSGGQWTLYDAVKDIREIEVAADGSLWLATAPLGTGQLCRFDPKVAECVVSQRDVTNRPILALALDPQGRALYGTNAAMYIYSEESDHLESYINEADQLRSNFIDSLASAPDGMLWVGTDAGIHRLDPAHPAGVWDTYTREDGIGGSSSWAAALTVAHDGTVWAAIINGDASRYQDGVWTSYEGLRSYDSVVVDTQGRAWFADGGKGIVVLNADGSHAMDLTTAEGLPSDDVQMLLADGDTIWIAMNNGLARYTNGAVEWVLDKDSLPHAYLRALALDASGALLIGANLSIVRYDGSEVEVLINFQKEGYMDWLTTLAVAPDGRIWAGTANGVFYSDEGSFWNRLTTADGLLTNFISALHVDQYGAVWIGGGSNFSGGGLLHIVP